MKTHVDLHTLAWLFKGSWSLLILLFKKIIIVNLGRRGLGQVDVQSQHCLGATNLHKNGDATQQNEDLMFYICKGYLPLFTCKII